MARAERAYDRLARAHGNRAGDGCYAAGAGEGVEGGGGEPERQVRQLRPIRAQHPGQVRSRLERRARLEQERRAGTYDNQ